MIELAKELYPINRSITGEGIEKSFAIFKRIHPEFNVLSFQTGEKVFDWQVPNVWNIKDAYIEHESGKRFCEFTTNNLSVVGYSEPINTVLSKQELLEHLHWREDLPTAIPYVTSYYKRTWGFCISHEEFE